MGSTTASTPATAAAASSSAVSAGSSSTGGNSLGVPTGQGMAARGAETLQKDIQRVPWTHTVKERTPCWVGPQEWPPRESGIQRMDTLGQEWEKQAPSRVGTPSRAGTPWDEAASRSPCGTGTLQMGTQQDRELGAGTQWGRVPQDGHSAGHGQWVGQRPRGT